MSAYVGRSQNLKNLKERSSLDGMRGLKTRFAARTGILTTHHIPFFGSKVLEEDAPLRRAVLQHSTLRLSMRLMGGSDNKPIGWMHPLRTEDSWFDAEELPASMERNLSQRVSFSGNVGLSAWVGCRKSILENAVF